MSSAALRPDPLRRPALAIGVFLAVAVGLAAFGRVQGAPPPVDTSDVRQTVSLHFQDAGDGSVLAVDSASNREIERIPAGQGGFVRVTMRSFAGERLRRGIGAQTPFLLQRHADGALVLSDPTTGRVMLLNAFGPANEGVFARLLDQ